MYNCVTASLPRSGSTWFRELVEAVTGGQTGAVYGGEWGIKDLNKAICIKTHYPEHAHLKLNDKKENFQKHIYVVRNPFDTLYSLYRKRTTFSGLVMDWGMEFIEDSIKKWNEHVKYWNTDNDKPLLVVRYEDLHDVDKRYQVMRDVASFLGKDAESLTDKHLENCFNSCSMDKLKQKGKYQQKYGKRLNNFFREGKRYNNIDKFNNQEFEYVITETEEMLKIAGYDIDFIKGIR